MDIINRVWTGQTGLAKIYWGYGILGGFLLGIAVGLLEPGSLAAISLMFVITGYIFMVSVGLWRAANLYEGFKLWAVLAKLIAAFNLVVSVLLLFAGLSALWQKLA